MADINGIVLHLFKHLDGSMLDTSVLINKSEDRDRTFPAFGNFDRLCFSPVNKFVDFLSVSSSAYRWIGGRKDIMLYPLETDSAQRHFVFGEKEEHYIQPPLFIKQNGENCRRGFLLVSMFYVSGRAKASVKPYSVFLDYCKNAITQVVEKANIELEKSGKNPVICEVFGTFNSSEIAVLWGADQFTDVQYIVDHLRYMYFFCETTGTQEPIFISTYTIVALSGSDFDVNSISGGAMIQLASSTMRGAEETREYNAPISYLLEVSKDDGQNQAKIDCCAGEYDYIVESLSPQLKLLVKLAKDKTPGALNIGNSKFKEFFSHSTTRLFYREQDIDENLSKIDWDCLIRVNVSMSADHSKDLQNGWGKIHEIAGTPDDDVAKAFSKFRNDILSNIPSTSSLGCNLDLLFSDYVQCVNTTPDRQWAADLKIQFSAAIKIFGLLLQSELSENGAIDGYIENIQRVISVLQQQIRHVSDAGKLFFEEPCSHSESTSQYDLLFHMYYGAVKHILSVVYSNESKGSRSKQSNLIPLIRFEPVPGIKSRLFFDISEQDERLVDISLPYDAWCEPGQYLPSLIHELYHYIAPVDRRVRNETFAKILLVELNTSAIQLLLSTYRNNAVRNSIKPISDISDVDFDAAFVLVLQRVRELCATYVNNVNISAILDLQADVQWADFGNALSKWCKSADGYSTAEGNYGLFLRNLCNFICTSHNSAIANKAINLADADKVLMQILVNELSQESTQKSDEETLADFLRYVQEAWQSNVEKQLREILPDLGMVQLSGIGPVEYMLIFATFQDKELTSPDELTQLDIELPLRIGFVLDWLIKPKLEASQSQIDAFEKMQADFRKRYVEYAQQSNWTNLHGSPRADTKVKSETLAGKWFSFFKIQFENYLANYSIYHDWLDALAKEQFIPLCRSSSTDELRKCLGEYYSALSSSDNSDKLFKSNISIVHRLQAQPFLEELHAPDNISCCPGGTPDHSLPRRIKQKIVVIQRDFCISHVDYLSSPISCATRQLEKTHHAVFGTEPQNPKNPYHGTFGTESLNCKFWYRGSQNANFEILPSIMVHFMDAEQMSKNADKGENASGTLWEFQRSILERFKYQADGAPEFINSASYTTSDYMAIMQHYGQLTTYLDWSEDAYSSLYFALEDEILMKKGTYGGEDAALYILDPMLYNRARKMLINNAAQKYSEQFCPLDTWFHRQGRSIQEMPDGHIPNLSVDYNKKRYGLFSLDVPDAEDINLTRATKYLEFDGEPKDATLSPFELEMWNLPLAVYTSRLNPRIRSQSGQFIAYSPFSIPVYGKKGGDCSSANRFSYLSLSKIQDYFLACFREEDPFMYKIKICAFAKNEIGRYLQKAGINRYRIYPELESIKL